MRGLESRLKYAKAIGAAQIFDADDFDDIGLAEAEELGREDYQEGRLFDDPPLLFQDAPILLEAWRQGWREQCYG